MKIYFNEDSEKVDEKLHRRTTVRMGIRVVQRAAAPPAPHLCNLTSQNLQKQQRNNGQKVSLFNCNSSPLQPSEKVDSRTGVNRSPVIELTKSETNISLGKRHDAEMDKDLLRVKRAPEQRDNDDSANENNEVTNRLTAEVEKEDGDEKENKEEKNVALQDTINSNKTPSHVSFKDQLLDEPGDTAERQAAHTNGPELNSNIDNSNVDDKQQTEICRGPPCGGKRPSLAAFLAQVPPPHAIVEKPFLLSDGCIVLEASLDKAIYSHGEEVLVSLQIRNFSNKTVKRIKVFIVQHVDVCMFSNGKFKNVVALINGKDDCPVYSGSTFCKTYGLTPTKSSTKNWIALEDSYSKTGTSLASTVTSTSPDNVQERNVFAIYVTYYVKVKLLVSVMGGELSLKLPFTLMHTCSEFDPTWTKELESPKEPETGEQEVTAEAPLKSSPDEASNKGGT